MIFFIDQLVPCEMWDKGMWDQRPTCGCNSMAMLQKNLQPNHILKLSIKLSDYGAKIVATLALVRDQGKGVARLRAYK